MIHAFLVTIGVLCAIAIFPYLPELLLYAFVGGIALLILGIVLAGMNELQAQGNLGNAFAFIGLLGAIIAGCWFLAKISDPVGERFARVAWVRAYRQRFPHTGYWVCEGMLWLAEGICGGVAILMIGAAIYERDVSLALGGSILFGIPAVVLHFVHEPHPDAVKAKANAMLPPPPPIPLPKPRPAPKSRIISKPRSKLPPKAKPKPKA